MNQNKILKLFKDRAGGKKAICCMQYFMIFHREPNIRDENRFSF